MVHTGAFIVLSRLPSERCGLSFSFASRDLTKRKRAGLQFAEVGPSFKRSTSSCNNALGTSPVSELCVRALRNSWLGRLTGACRSNRADLLHLGNEVFEQVLDAVSKSCRRARAAGAGAAHMQKHHPVAVTLEGDIAAVLSDGRADARLEQFLDGLDRLLVLGREIFVRFSGFGDGRSAFGHGFARQVVLHDGAENGGLEMLPFALALGHADEVGAEEHAGDAVDLEQAGGERRAFALGGIAEFHGSFAEHGPAGQEFQGGRVGRRFGLNKHRLLSSVTCGWPEKAPAPVRMVLGDTWLCPGQSQGSQLPCRNEMELRSSQCVLSRQKVEPKLPGEIYSKIGMGLEAYSRERARTMAIASELLLVVQDQAGCGIFSLRVEGRAHTLGDGGTGCYRDFVTTSVPACNGQTSAKKLRPWKLTSALRLNCSRWSGSGGTAPKATSSSRVSGPLLVV